jgi:hypothetical protein
VPRKLVRTRIARERGFIYFVDRDGDVASIPAPGRGARRARKLLRTGLERQPGYLYFIDRDGDVSRSPLAHPDLQPD